MRAVRYLIAGAAIMTVAVWLAAIPAKGSHPGSNGRIVVLRNGDLVTFTPSGDRVRNLTRSLDSSVGIGAYSPNGLRIAFGCDEQGTYQSDLCVMRSDGSRVRRIYDGPGGAFDPDWSPDGRWLVFRRSTRRVSGLWKIRADGTRLTAVDRRNGLYPAWGHDGRIVFNGRTGRGSGIVTIKPNGNDRRLVVRNTNNFGTQEADWSPHGSKIVFVGYTISGGEPGSAVIHTVRPNGRELRSTERSGTNPAWSPNGRWIVFEGAGAIRKMRPRGSRVRTIYDPRADVLFPDWQPR